MVRLDPLAFAIDRERFGLLDGGGSPHRLGGVMGYFSFVCLTTLGFGDVTPSSPLARGLVCVEAVLSQIYMAVFVARLVSQYLASGLVTVTVNPRDDDRPGAVPRPHFDNRGALAHQDRSGDDA
jgi:hypothetical protein